MIDFCCRQCGYTTSVDAEHAGRRTRCPKCQTPGIVPDRDESAPTTKRLAIAVSVGVPLVVLAIAIVVSQKPTGYTVADPLPLDEAVAELSKTSLRSTSMTTPAENAYVAKLRPFLDQSMMTANLLADPTTLAHCRDQLLKCHEAYARLPDPPASMAVIHAESRKALAQLNLAVIDLELAASFARMGSEADRQRNVEHCKAKAIVGKTILKMVAGKI